MVVQHGEQVQGVRYCRPLNRCVEHGARGLLTQRPVQVTPKHAQGGQTHGAATNNNSVASLFSSGEKVLGGAWGGGGAPGCEWPPHHHPTAETDPPPAPLPQAIPQQRTLEDT
jgi:hypothetical protein